LHGPLSFNLMITEESFLDFQCPYCRAAVSFPKENAGLAQACPECNESLIVPEDGGEVGKSLPLPIETARLVIRRFAPGDWKDLIELTAAEELFQFTEGRPLEEEEVLHWLESDAHVKLTTPNQYFYLALETRDPVKLIGYIGLLHTDPQQFQAALNIFVNKAHQRQGFALEALDAVLGFCFEAIKLHRIAVSCDSRNTAARGLFEKLGLRREGEFIQDHQLHGEWANTLWYAALREEYTAHAAGSVAAK
jgi:RimJ/RimL family protein N-acetyltransferase